MRWPWRRGIPVTVGYLVLDPVVPAPVGHAHMFFPQWSDERVSDPRAMLECTCGAKSWREGS